MTRQCSVHCPLNWKSLISNYWLLLRSQEVLVKVCQRICRYKISEYYAGREVNQQTSPNCSWPLCKTTIILRTLHLNGLNTMPKFDANVHKFNLNKRWQPVASPSPSESSSSRRLPVSRGSRAPESPPRTWRDIPPKKGSKRSDRSWLMQVNAPQAVELLHRTSAGVHASGSAEAC